MTTAVHTRTHEGFPKVPLGLDFLRLFPPFSDLLFLLGHLIHPPRFSPLPSFPSSLARYIVVVLEEGGGGGKKGTEKTTQESFGMKSIRQSAGNTRPAVRLFYAFEVALPSCSSKIRANPSPPPIKKKMKK